MKDINAAYEQITKERSGRGDSPTGGYRQNAYGGTAAELLRRGQCVSTGALRHPAGRSCRAEALLTNYSNHNAEWNFLKGVVCRPAGAGWTKPSAIMRLPARWTPAIWNISGRWTIWKTAPDRLTRQAEPPLGRTCAGSNLCLPMCCLWSLCSGSVPICCYC